MPAETLRLIASLRGVLWREGGIRGERLRHDVDEHGDHHFTLTIKREEGLRAMHVRAKSLGIAGRAFARTLAR
jgi:hypothetical protein